MTKTAFILMIFVGAFAFAYLHLKRKKATNDKPTNLLNSDLNADAPEVAAPKDQEDDMLRRHHLHNIRLMLVATTFPHPTDSTLSRHYDEMIDAKAEDCLADEAKLAHLVAEYEATQNAPFSADNQTSVAPCKKTAIPEDSALRRHYLSTLRVNIEKNKAPCPTDSALRRHYDAMINAEIENHLACH